MTQSLTTQRPAEAQRPADAAPARSSEPSSSQAGPSPAQAPQRRVLTCAELDLLA